MELGARIRQLRTQKGMTQSRLAGSCITRNMLSQIENGLASPSVKTLEYLAQELQVSVGYLLSGETGDLLAPARQLLQKGRTEDALRAAEASGASGDEYEMLLSLCYGHLAYLSFLDGDTERAESFADVSLEHGECTVYRSSECRAQMLWIKSQCALSTKRARPAFEDFRRYYEQWGWEARYHLLLARYYIDCEQLQMAERESWLITALPESEKPQYLMLRGILSMRQGKYAAAVSYLKQVESREPSGRNLRRELYSLLETAYREMEDYKSAYYYAAKLREIK